MENKFYTNVTIGRYGCLMIIDDSPCNMISEYAAEKLGLTVVDHPCPYDVIRNNQPIRVTKQACVSFSLGKNYKDSIFCDIVHMDDCHIHLGQPWISYRDVSHDPINNYYSFIMGRKFILVPMTKEYVQHEVELLKGRVKNWLDEKFKIDITENVEENVDNDIFEAEGDGEPIFDEAYEEKEIVEEVVLVPTKEPTEFKSPKQGVGSSVSLLSLAKFEADTHDYDKDFPVGNFVWVGPVGVLVTLPNHVRAAGMFSVQHLVPYNDHDTEDENSRANFVHPGEDDVAGKLINWVMKNWHRWKWKGSDQSRRLLTCLYVFIINSI